MYINEIFKNMTEKNGKNKGVNVKNGLYLGTQSPKVLNDDQMVVKAILCHPKFL